MRLADSVVVVLAPGMGDGIQAAKAGILEIADILVVNKSDHDGAAGTVRDLKGMVALGRAGAQPHRWRVPVLSTVASKAIGIDELLAALDAHRHHLDVTGGRAARRHLRAEVAVQAVVSSGCSRRWLRRRGWNGSPRPRGRSPRVEPTTTGPRSRSWIGSVPVPAGEPLGYRGDMVGHDHCHERGEAVRHADRRRRCVDLRRTRRVLRHSRSERGRQDHPAGDDRGPAAARFRRHRGAGRAGVAAKPQAAAPDRACNCRPRRSSSG